MDLHEKIEALSRRISELSRQQSAISRSLLEMLDELEQLKNQAAIRTPQKTELEPIPVKTIEVGEPIEAPSTRIVPPFEPAAPSAKRRSSFEEFIGKNLASKVGILITIVGIFIGARYAIEHNLVSPLVRIISGYLSGVALIALAIFLKQKYESYSSVLMGGGLAVLYFITFTAYAFYGLLPQSVSFILMVLFTAGAVYASLLYNRVIIAHLGLVGAYAIPFLLSDNSGRYWVLLSYIAIINVGILVLAFRKYWKSLFYAAFFLTWIIYGGWHLLKYDDIHYLPAFAFRTIYFALFYFTFLAYKLVKKEKYGADAVMVLLSNSFIFYGLGFDAISLSENGSGNLGIFTIINAAIHFGISQIIRPRLADKALYYLIFGLTIVFITIAIPVQLDGNWVTLLWLSEALLMFIVGRTRGVANYEKLSGLLLLLALISLGEDWTNYGDQFGEQSSLPPFANIIFVSGLLISVAVGVMLWLSRNKKYTSALPAHSLYGNYFPYIIAVVFLLVSYLTFYLEILAYLWQSDKAVYYGHFDSYRPVVLLLYSMVYVAIITGINHRWVKSADMSMASLAGIGLLALLFVVYGLPLLHDLSRYAVNPYLRYAVAAVMCLILYQGWEIARISSENRLAGGWMVLVHAVVLSILSAEYLHWSGVSGDNGQYKLGLSILWGVYGLYMIVWGIYKKQKYLRLTAIAVFVITLVKLFFYDLAEAGTVTKTVSFISLGAILLLVSYLYNRYKEVLFGKDE